MMKDFKNNDLKISYNIEGNGNPIVLIHGFLETSEIWESFAAELVKNAQVISIDLPGHGASELYEKPFTMCKYAEAVNAVLLNENIEKAIIVGHSMGGYAAMAFAENYPQRMSALCLFHSHPFADADDKLDSRNNMIKEFEQGRGEAIIQAHTKNLFATENTEKFDTIIRRNYESAMKMSPENIISSIETMRDRKDRASILKNLKQPFLLIHGEKDNFISSETAKKMQLPEKGRKLILKNSGHAGFIEEPQKSLEALIDLMRQIQ